MKTDRLPGAVKLAADSMNVSSQQLMKMMENNQLLAKDFLPKFAVAMRESVREGDALNKMMQSTQAQMGRFGNSVNDAALAFSKGGFNKAFTDFLNRATTSMDAMTDSGFFDSLGFGFRMLVAPINSVMEIIGGLGGIWKRANEEGGEFRDNLITIAAILGTLLLPVLFRIGGALAPFLVFIGGITALGDIMQGLAGNSSEFKTNLDLVTESLKNGKMDWEAFAKVAGEVGLALGGIVLSAKILRKLNPFKGKNSVIPEVAKTAGKTAGKTGFLSTAGSFLSRTLGIGMLGLHSSKLGDSTLESHVTSGMTPEQKQAYKNGKFLSQWGVNTKGNSDVDFYKSTLSSSGFVQDNPNNYPDLPTFNGNRMEEMTRLNSQSTLPIFDSNNRMTSGGTRIPSATQSNVQAPMAPSVTISELNINGEKSPDDIRVNMETYVTDVFNDVFKDAMRETIR